MDEKELKAKCRQLFHFRCIMCRRTTIIVHEMIPRSNGEVALDLDNMVTLCSEDHNWAHMVGSRVSAPILREAREKVLNAYSSSAQS